MRSLVLAVIPLLAGCSYPQFGFGADAVASDSEVADSSRVADSAVVDDSGGSDGIFPTDDVADTTLMGDTTVVDTAKADTAVVPADTGPKPGCAGSTVLFCRDFDTVPSVASGWTDSYLKGGGSLAFGTTLFRSTPHSMFSSLPTSTSGEFSANVHTSFTATSENKGMYLDFWLRFDFIPSTPGPLVAKIGRGVGGRGLALYVGDNTLGVDAMGPVTTIGHRMTRIITANTWMHVRIEGVLSPTSGSFKLYVDDILELNKTGLPTTAATGTDVKLNVGLYTNDPGNAIKSYFDDVKFDWL